MLKDFKTHIETNFPELLETKFLLACSGGLDSMVLTHLCHKSKLYFDLAHCNFQLRSAESDGDEQFVKDLAEEMNKLIHVTHFKTMSYVNKNKVSIEMAARELRYTWFAEIMRQNNINTLVTAHHADDNLETFLINLSRGTGIDGLTGIPEKTESISRPLLPFSRAQILEYAKSENLSWREDSTNAETVHLRNKVRHELVSKLKELHPTFLNNFKKTQAYLSGTAVILENHIQSLKTRLFSEDDGMIRIAIADLEVLNPQKAYLHALFREYGFTAWNDVSQLLSSTSGKEVLSKSHRLVKDREFLLLKTLELPDSEHYQIVAFQTELRQPVHLILEEVSSIDETGDHILYVDKAALKYPLVVRKWEKGDYFYPFGMAGKKKLSKYFKDEKIDVISKEKQWLLCSGDNVVWVIGKRSDNRFRVKENTKNILRFTYVK